MLLMFLVVVASYRPSIPVAYAAKELGYGVEEEFVTWLKEKSITLEADGSKIDCKTSMAALSAI